MNIRKFVAMGAIALAFTTVAQAATVPLTKGSWQNFDIVDPAFGLGNNGFGWIDIINGDSLSFTFTIGTGEVGFLTVVDLGFAGDQFKVFANGGLLGETSAAVDTFVDNVLFGPNDADAALADSRFSRGSYVFTAGTYTVTGELSRSALDDTGMAINATVGALQLQIPEPSTLALLLAAAGAMTMAGRRRAR